MSEDDEKLIQEIRGEQHIPQVEEDSVLLGYINSAKYDINEKSGEEIDYGKDLNARNLLKNFVLYARFNNLAEFKQRYAEEYVYLQAKYYNKNSSV